MDKTREEFEQWTTALTTEERLAQWEAWQAAKELYAPKWICVEERFPAMVNTQDDECYSDYVLALLDDGEQILATAYPDGTWSDEYDTLYEQVIKWMELPK